jgi:hypothetical protein
MYSMGKELKIQKKTAGAPPGTHKDTGTTPAA